MGENKLNICKLREFFVELNDFMSLSPSDVRGVYQTFKEVKAGLDYGSEEFHGKITSLATS